MAPSITLVSLKVARLARARAFYEALGFEAPSTPERGVAFYQAGQVVLGLWEREVEHGDQGTALAYNVSSPEEVDPLLAAAVAAGGTLLRPAAEATWGGYTGAFADPDGYIWEVEHNPAWTLTKEGAPRLPGPR
jgi:predicted lactoylglutathione lyase